MDILYIYIYTYIIYLYIYMYIYVYIYIYIYMYVYICGIYKMEKQINWKQLFSSFNFYISSC